MNAALFVQNVKFYSERKGVKPTAACRESGAGERLLENVKRGSEPSVGKVQMLAHYLGTTVSALIGETEPVESAVRFAPTSALERLNAQLDEIGQARLMAYADDLVASGKYKKGTTAEVG